MGDSIPFSLVIQQNDTEDWRVITGWRGFSGYCAGDWGKWEIGESKMGRSDDRS